MGAIQRGSPFVAAVDFAALFGRAADPAAERAAGSAVGIGRAADSAVGIGRAADSGVGVERGRECEREGAAEGAFRLGGGRVPWRCAGLGRGRLGGAAIAELYRVLLRLFHARASSLWNGPRCVMGAVGIHGRDRDQWLPGSSSPARTGSWRMFSRGGMGQL